MYSKIEKDGIIIAIAKNGSVGRPITEDKYNEILSMLHNRPTAPEGFAYRLTKELEWELYELPTIEEPEEATTENYEAALAEMGVNKWLE